MMLLLLQLRPGRGVHLSVRGVVRGASSARGSVDDSSSGTTQSPTPQGVIDLLHSMSNYMQLVN